MRAILRVPASFGRFLWGFINPSRTAGRVPYGRFTIAVQLLAALLFIGYTLTKKSLPLPFAAKPYEVEVIFPNAQGLDRVDDPAVAVAGTPQGRVTDVAYDPSRGAAVVTMSLNADVRGKIFADASAAIRPGSAIQNLIVNVDPGTPEAGPLPDDQPIPPQHTASYVAIDDLTSVLDADTRAYVQILVSEAQQALHGQESTLRSSLRELGDLADTTTPISRALAARRALLTRLVGDLDEIFTVLGRRGAQLGDTVAAGEKTLSITTAREAEVAALVRELGPTLVAANDALSAVNRTTKPALTAFDELAPAASAVAPAFESTRALVPKTAALVDSLGALVRQGSEPLELMVKGTEGIQGRVAAEVPVAQDLTALAKRLDRYKAGMAQLADTLSGALSVNDNAGTYGQVDVIGFEDPKPENLGLPAAAANKRPGGHSLMQIKLAAALEKACRRDSTWACLLRFQVPGLSSIPLGSGDGKGG
jgi:phospholipid/cholesterol/gamma-HCH transport system substrate-binding protein